MVTFPLDFEAINVPPRSAKVIMPTIKSQTRSTYAGAKQEQFWNDGPMVLQMTFPPMLREKAERLVAFKASLDLGVGGNAFYAGIATQREPMGTGAGTPQVSGNIPAGAYEIPSDQWAPNQTVLKAGDWIQFGTGTDTRLYKSMTDAVSDVSGEVILTVRPRLRLALADNDPVIVQNCRGLWELQASSVEWDIDVIGHERMVLEAIEALNVNP